MPSDDPLDRLFSAGLEKAEFDPPALGWNDVKKKLETHRWYSITYKVAAVFAACGALAVGFYFIALQPDSSIQQAQDQAVSRPESPSIISNHRESTSTISVAATPSDDRADKGGSSTAPVRNHNQPARAVQSSITPSEIILPETQSNPESITTVAGDQFVAEEKNTGTDPVHLQSLVVDLPQIEVSFYQANSWSTEKPPAGNFLRLARDIKSGEADLGLLRGLRRTIRQVYRRQAGNDYY